MLDNSDNQSGPLNGTKGPQENVAPNSQAKPGPSQNLPIALKHARAGIPVFPARVSYCKNTERWKKKPFVTGWRLQPR